MEEALIESARRVGWFKTQSAKSIIYNHFATTNVTSLELDTTLVDL